MLYLIGNSMLHATCTTSISLEYPYLSKMYCHLECELISEIQSYSDGGIAAVNAIVVPMWATSSSPSPGWTPSSAASIAVSCGLSTADIKQKLVLAERLYSLTRASALRESVSMTRARGYLCALDRAREGGLKPIFFFRRKTSEHRCFCKRKLCIFGCRNYVAPNSARLCRDYARGWWLCPFYA